MIRREKTYRRVYPLMIRYPSMIGQTYINKNKSYMHFTVASGMYTKQSATRQLVTRLYLKVVICVPMYMVARYVAWVFPVYMQLNTTCLLCESMPQIRFTFSPH